MKAAHLQSAFGKGKRKEGGRLLGGHILNGSRRCNPRPHLSLTCNPRRCQKSCCLLFLTSHSMVAFNVEAHCHLEQLEIPTEGAGSASLQSLVSTSVQSHVSWAPRQVGAHGQVGDLHGQTGFPPWTIWRSCLQPCSHPADRAPSRGHQAPTVGGPRPLWALVLAPGVLGSLAALLSSELRACSSTLSSPSLAPRLLHCLALPPPIQDSRMFPTLGG